MNHKQIAKKEGISLRTAYRRYPVEKPQVTQAQIFTLLLHGYSIRQVATILCISKSQAHRMAS